MMDAAPDPSTPARVAVFINRRPLVAKFVAAMAEAGIEAILVTSHDALAADPGAFALLREFQQVHIVSDYESPLVQGLLVDVCTRANASIVISLAEVDVIRTAETRRQLSIAGQSVESAVSFRDKRVMKALAVAADVLVAEEVVDPTSQVGTLASVDHPVVVKPVRGVASKRTFVVYSDRELEQALNSFSEGDDALVEGFVPGAMRHVDGLMKNGRLMQGWPSAYFAPQWSTMYGNEPNLSAMLAETHPDFRPLMAATCRLIEGYPPTDELTPFHAEFFVTDSGEIVLCEIASRAGGAGIVEAYMAAFDVDLQTVSIRAQLGLPDPTLHQKPKRLAGWGWFPPRNAVLSRFPAEYFNDRAIRYTPPRKAGGRFSQPEAVTDSVAELVFILASDTTPEQELEEIASWWAENAQWTDPASQESRNE